MFITLLRNITTKWIFLCYCKCWWFLHLFWYWTIYSTEEKETRKERRKKRKIRSMEVFNRIFEVSYVTGKCSKRRNYHEWKSKLIRKDCCWYLPPVWYQRVGLLAKENVAYIFLFRSAKTCWLWAHIYKCKHTS